MHKETYTKNPGKNLGKSPRRKLCIDLTCPLQEMECLKTGNWLKKFSIVHLKSRNWLKKFSIVRLKTGKG